MQTAMTQMALFLGRAVRQVHCFLEEIDYMPWLTYYLLEELKAFTNIQVALLLGEAVPQVALIVTLCHDLPMFLRGGGVVAMTEVGLFRDRAMPRVA